MEKPSKLLILWTNGDQDVFLHMVSMYAINSLLRTWWEEVVLLIWGSSTRRISEDEVMQARLKEVQEAGVRVIACIRCAENLGVVEKLQALGIEVFTTGSFLTEWLKSGEKILTI
jgi:hypothetical protein